MNTAEFDSRLPRPSRLDPRQRTGPRLQAVAAAPIGITVLSTDSELCEAIRAAVDAQHPVSVATSMDEAMQLAANGRCGIFVTDQALTQQALVQSGKQLRTHDPATITIAVGRRGDDSALIGLLSSAVVERFMLKPVQPSLARLVIRSAANEYQSLKRRARQAPPEQVALPDKPAVAVTTATQVRQQPSEPAPREHAETVAPPPSRLSLVSVGWMAAAILLMAGAATWWMTRTPAIDPQQIIATNLAAAAQAINEGRYVDPPESSALHYYSVVLSLDAAHVAARRGVESIAARMMEEVKLAIVEGRLAEAGIALERVRRLSPDQRRLAALDSELRKAQASQLSRLQAPISVPPVQPNIEQKRVVPAAKPAQKAKVATVEEMNEPAVVNAPARVQVSAPTAEPALPQTAQVALDAPAPVVIEPSPAAPPPSAPMPASVAPKIVSPKIVSMVQPQFPQEARIRSIEGWVEMDLVVSAAGEVTGVRVNATSNGRFFERAAVAAARQWRYEPRTLPNGVVTQPVRVRVDFRLEE